ncbi:MAG: phosphatase PAP2 family protein [Nitrospiraceae bacterium]
MSWDEAFFRAINSLAGRHTLLDHLMVDLADPDLLWIPGILLAVFWYWTTRREALFAGPSLAAAIGLVDFLGARLKDLAARPRPCMVLTDVHPLLACGKTFGFPSNHATNTAAAAAFLHTLYPKSGWISWPLVVVIGFARVYIGAHYVTDVLGGWMIGGLLGAGVAWLLLRWPRFRSVATPAPLQYKNSSAGTP